MTRLLIQMIVIVFVLVTAWFFLRGMGKPASGPRTFRPRKFGDVRKEVNKGELKQDPVSGTYVSAQDAIQKTIDGTVYYFVSEDNAETFINSRRKG